MWKYASDTVTAALGMAGVVVTIWPPEDGKLWWFIIFGALVALSIVVAHVKDRLEGKEADQHRREVLAYTSGGDNFPYVTIISSFSKQTSSDTCPAILAPHESTPLFEVHFRLRDAESGEELATGYFPKVIYGSPVGAGIQLGEGDYKITLNALNGFFEQKLRLKVIDGRMQAWIEVKKPQTRTQKEQVLFKQIPYGETPL